LENDNGLINMGRLITVKFTEIVMDAKKNQDTAAVVSNKEVDDLEPEEEKPAYCCCCFQKFCKHPA
jgi:hypothetical protein